MATFSTSIQDIETRKKKRITYLEAVFKAYGFQPYYQSIKEHLMQKNELETTILIDFNRVVVETKDDGVILNLYFDRLKGINLTDEILSIFKLMNII